MYLRYGFPPKTTHQLRSAADGEDALPVFVFVHMLLDKCRHWLATCNPRGRFLQSMQAARGFAANPRLLTGAFARWREVRGKNRKLQREIGRKHFEANVGGVGEVKSWREMWVQTKEGTLVVWAPVIGFMRRWVTQPARTRIKFPAQRFVARSRDRAGRGTAFVKSFFVSTVPRGNVRQGSPGHAAAQQGQAAAGAASASSNSLMAVAQERGRLITQNASAFSKHFREFMLDPNFKRRQLMWKMRQWEPTTNAGRAMAPVGIGLVAFMVLSAIAWMIVSDTMMERERRANELKSMMLQGKTNDLGIVDEEAPRTRVGARRAGTQRDENDALLDLFTVRRW